MSSFLSNLDLWMPEDMSPRLEILESWCLRENCTWRHERYPSINLAMDQLCGRDESSCGILGSLRYSVRERTGWWRERRCRQTKELSSLFLQHTWLISVTISILDTPIPCISLLLIMCGGKMSGLWRERVILLPLHLLHCGRLWACWQENVERIFSWDTKMTDNNSLLSHTYNPFIHLHIGAWGSGKEEGRHDASSHHDVRLCHGRSEWAVVCPSAPILECFSTWTYAENVIDKNSNSLLWHFESFRGNPGVILGLLRLWYQFLYSFAQLASWWWLHAVATRYGKQVLLYVLAFLWLATPWLPS